VDDSFWARLADRIGDTFAFRAPDGMAIEAQLVAADRSEQGTTAVLTLTFRTDDGIAAQGTYEVRHPDLGTFALFVVPRSRTEFDADVTWLDAP
jgi:uncharacterized protein DUF6916